MLVRSGRRAWPASTIPSVMPRFDPRMQTSASGPVEAHPLRVQDLGLRDVEGIENLRFIGFRDLQGLG